MSKKNKPYVPRKNPPGLPEGTAPKAMYVGEMDEEFARKFSNDVTIPDMEPGKDKKDKFVKLHKIMKEYKRKNK